MFQLLTFGGVVTTIIIIIYRWFATVGAALRSILDPEVPVYKKVVLGGHGFWGCFLRAVLDTTLTFVGMGVFRLIVAGVHSAPIGAVCGLLMSLSVTGLPYYTEHVKKQVRSKAA